MRLQHKGEVCILEVEDNGIGLPSKRQEEGTGSRLVRAMARQLGGQLQWSGPPGTRFMLTFPAREATDFVF